MTEYSRIILKAVEDAGQWGVLRTGYIGLEIWRKMAESIGMDATVENCVFRHKYFADGIKVLDPKAAMAMSCMFGIELQTINELNRRLAENQAQ